MNNELFNDSKEKFFWLLIVLIFAFCVSYPLFSTTTIVMGHDFTFHLSRLEGMKESLLGGQFPVRLTGYTFNNYGETSGFFYPNLFFYIPALLRILDFSIITSYNLFCILINIMTALIAYWSFSKLFNSIRQGAVMTIIYTGFFYRIVDLYSRSSIGEAISMIFIPLVISGLWLTLHRSKDYWPAVVIGFTGILQSHIISSIMIVAAALIIIAYSYHESIKNLKALNKIALFTTLLNLWFYVPFIDLYHKIHFHMQDIALNNNPHYLSSNVYNFENIITIQAFCGFAIFFIIFLFIAVNLWDNFHHKEPRYKINRLFWIMLVFGLICSLGAFSRTICHILEAIPIIGKHISVLQFSFRLMTFGTIAFSYCAATALIQMIKNLKYSRAIIITCCLLIAQTNILYLTYASDLTMSRKNIGNDDWRIKSFTIPKDFLNMNGFNLGYQDYIYADIQMEDLIYDMNQNSWFENIYKSSKIPFDDIRPAEFISNFNKIGMTVKFTANVKEQTNFILPLFYYPCYEAYTSTGLELPVSSSDNNHRLTVTVPAGETNITVRYADTLLWKIANIISLTGLMAFIFQIYREYKRRKYIS